jgi:N-acetyl-anhydromuramyl-L-alanine amidase AmpD
MAQSPEWPDLKWVQPRAFGRGRDGKAVRYIVIHYTAGSERASSAEDGAASDAKRTDGTSTHYFHDQNSTVQCVHTMNRANTARHKGNRLGIQHELCGTAQTRAQWLDAASLPTLQRCARQVARDCRKYGIPVRRLSVSETRRAWTEYPNGPRGIVGHVDCTFAYPEDGGDHTDPGRHFPWDVLLDMVRAEVLAQTQKETTVTTPTSAQMASAATTGVLGYASGGLPTWAEQPANRNFLNSFTELFREVKEQDTDLDAVQAAQVVQTALLASIVQDPADMDNPEQHPIVAAVRWAQANPAPAAATAEADQSTEDNPSA